VVNFTSRPLLPGKEPRYPLNRRLGGPHTRPENFGKKSLIPAGIRIRDFSIRSQFTIRRTKHDKSFVYYHESFELCSVNPLTSVTLLIVKSAFTMLIELCPREVIYLFDNRCFEWHRGTGIWLHENEIRTPVFVTLLFVYLFARTLVADLFIYLAWCDLTWNDRICTFWSCAHTHFRIKFLSTCHIPKCK
jgi:hypothetical protein